MTDGDEHTGDVEPAHLTGDGVAHQRTLELVVADEIVDRRVPADLDLRVAVGPFLHDLRGPQLVATHEHGDLGGELGEERGLFDGRVATAHDSDLLTAEEEPVARGAGGQTVADEACLGLEAEHQALGTGGDDDRMGEVQFVAHPHLERPLGEVDRRDLGGDELGAEPRCLLAHVLHQFGAHDAVGEAGEVLDLGGEHELPAGLVGGGRRLAFDDERSQAGSGRVDGGGEASRA